MYIKEILGPSHLIHYLNEFGIIPGKRMMHLHGDLYKIGHKVIVLRLPKDIKIVYDRDN